MDNLGCSLFVGCCCCVVEPGEISAPSFSAEVNLVAAGELTLDKSSIIFANMRLIFSSTSSLPFSASFISVVSVAISSFHCFACSNTSLPTSSLAFILGDMTVFCKLDNFDRKSSMRDSATRRRVSCDNASSIKSCGACDDTDEEEP